MVMSENEWKRSTDLAGQHVPKTGIIRFENGELAEWREEMLAWAITLSDRAWGDPGEMIRAYGGYTILDVR